MKASGRDVASQTGAAPPPWGETEVLVVGLGVTGRAVARALARRGASVLASDAAADVPAEAVAELTELGVRVETGSHTDASEALEGVDLVVPSPGISPHRGFLAEVLARGVRVASELDLAQEMTDATVIGVTGTNGKTTVCRLAERFLRAAGRRAYACGNTELPFLAAVDDHPSAELFVVEASSFRLAFCRTFHPRVAVYTNLAPDHLNWHSSFEDYRESKAKLVAQLGDGDLYVYPADQPELAGLAPEHGARRVPFGVVADQTSPSADGDDGAWADGDEVLVRLDGRLVLAGGAGRLWARGPHFAADAAAAAAAALFCGAGGDAIERGLQGFEPDPHRLEYVGELDGVRYYDDSVSTNPHATVAAVRALSSVVLLAGGMNKGLDVGPLREVADRLRGVVAYGHAATEIASVFSSTGLPVAVTDDLRSAVEAARGQARAGDAVLLSPACASFDAYAGYAERGLEFRSICRSLGVGI